MFLTRRQLSENGKALMSGHPAVLLLALLIAYFISAKSGDLISFRVARSVGLMLVLCNKQQRIDAIRQTSLQWANIRVLEPRYLATLPSVHVRNGETVKEA